MTDTVGVGLVGLGTVGAAVATRLVAEWELLGARAGRSPVLRRAAVRDTTRQRGLSLPGVTVDADARALVRDPAIDIVVELMGGVDEAGVLIEVALREGKAVVTANKAVMAAHGLELAALAAEHGTSLRYEAAAGGGLPIVALLRDSLRGDRVSELEMIINGTTNIMLTLMARDGVGFGEALADAQRRGFAEADPSADVDGLDAAAKLVLLSRLAFDVAAAPDGVDVEGIRGVTGADVACATALGAGIKLVAHALFTGGALSLCVRPTVVRAGHPLHGIDDGANGVVVTSDLAQRVAITGVGGGGAATASAVVSDIVAAVRSPHEPPPLPSRAFVAAPAGEVERAGYIRVRLAATADAERLVLSALEDRGLTVVASAASPGDPAELAVLTATAPRAMRDRAVETLESLVAVEQVCAALDCVGPA